MKVAPILFLIASSSCFAQGKPDAPGTYELIVCKSACSFENQRTAIAHGVVVLFENPLARADVEKLDPFHFGEPSEIIRACFAGEASKDAETFAFGRKTGVTSWSQKSERFTFSLSRSEVLTFSLFRSVDAGYAVNVEYRGDAFSGKGVSWGAGVAAPGYTPDVIVGRRIGPADISACTKRTKPAA